MYGVYFCILRYRFDIQSFWDIVDSKDDTVNRVMKNTDHSCDIVNFDFKDVWSVFSFAVFDRRSKKNSQRYGEREIGFWEKSLY